MRKLLVALVVLAIALVAGVSLVSAFDIPNDVGGHTHVAGVVTDPETCGTYVRGAEGSGRQLNSANYSYGMPSPLGIAGAAGAIDFHWVHDTDGDFIVWDMGAPVSVVDVFPSIDHGPVPGEALEWTVWGSNNLALPEASWAVGDITTIFDSGWDAAWIADDWVSRWEFPAPYRYVGVHSGGPKALLQSSDAEIDAVCAPLSVGGLPCVNPVPSPAGWTARAPVPNGLEGAAASIIGDKIYVTHGFIDLFTGDSTMTQIYDIPSNTWDPPGANAAVARSELAGVCAIEDGVARHFAIGGRFQTTVEVYDPGTDTWSARAPMLTARRGLCASYVPTLGPQGTIFAIGGGIGDRPHSGVATGANEAYGVASGGWIAKAPMPTPVMGVYACAWHPGTGLIYVFGGYDSAVGAVSNLVQRYDPVANAWLPNGAPMPTARSNAIAGICANDIYVIGGLNPQLNRTENERYDPVADAWVAASSLPSARSEMASTAISTGQAIYAIGSGVGGVALNLHDRFECGVPVGGIVELRGNADSSASASGSSSGDYSAPIAAAIAAGALVVVAAGGWYARRRFRL
jgi:N-acetylneuraminic acid mutarotase